MDYSELIETLDETAYNNHEDEMNTMSKFCVERFVRVPGKKRKLKQTFWTSGVCGSPIRDAVTGYKTGYVVGSSSEDLFFKVSMANGITGQNSLVLFYDCPERFEEHYNCSVSEDIKDTWNEKKQRAMIKRIKV